MTDMIHNVSELLKIVNFDAVDGGIQWQGLDIDNNTSIEDINALIAGEGNYSTSKALAPWEFGDFLLCGDVVLDERKISRINIFAIAASGKRFLNLDFPAATEREIERRAGDIKQTSALLRYEFDWGFFYYSYDDGKSVGPIASFVYQKSNMAKKRWFHLFD